MTFCRLIPFLMLPVAFGSEPANAQITAEQAIANAQRLISAGKCGMAATRDEIIVCGTGTSKYRLPLPVDRPPIGQRVFGAMPRASIDVARNRECGVHRGQRQCSIRDLRAFGYGGGSVPVRVLVMLGKKIIDPDAELGPPGGYPITPNARE